MTRGEIWTGAGADYMAKPRPVLILQDDAFSAIDSVVIVPFTSDPTVAPLFRYPVVADAVNGLSRNCSLMIDKVSAIPRDKLRQHIGRLDARQMAQVSGLVVTYLGLARAGRNTSSP